MIAKTIMLTAVLAGCSKLPEAKLDFGGTTFDFAARSAAMFDKDGKKKDVPDAKGALLELCPMGFLNNSFALSAGQPGVIGFYIILGKDLSPYDRTGLSFALTLPAGFEFVGSTFGDSKTMKREALANGATKYTFGYRNTFSMRWQNYNRMTAVVRSTSVKGTEGQAKLEMFKNGETFARELNFRLYTIDAISSERPERYMNGFYSAGQSTYYFGDHAADDAYAELLKFCGVQWVLGEKNDEYVLAKWREAGVKVVTPPIGIANGYMFIGVPETCKNMPDADRFKFCKEWVPGVTHYNASYAKNSICPFAAIEERPFFVTNVVPECIDKRLKGMDGSWVNWEPHMYEGYGCDCDRCREEFAKWKAKTGKDDIHVFRSEVHARYLKVIDKYVRRATKDSKYPTGLIPGVCWRASTTAWEKKLFSAEYKPADYVSDFEWFDPWGPYIYWNADKPLAKNEREPLWHWFFAKDMREQCDRWSKPERRMKIQAFPNALQGHAWVSQPEWVSMAMDAFFFNRWENTLLYLFPDGYDARYLKAFAMANTRAARCEKFVWDGVRCDEKIAIDVVPEYAPARPLVSDYVPSSTNQLPLQCAAFDLDGVRLVAALNFCDFVPAFFTLKTTDLKGKYRIVDEDGTLWYEGDIQRGAFLMVGGARTKVFYLIPSGSNAGPKAVSAVNGKRLRELYEKKRDVLKRQVEKAIAEREGRLNEVKQKGIID